MTPFLRLSSLRVATRARLLSMRATACRTAAGGTRAMSAAAVDPEKSKYVISKTDAPYSKGKHRSNALELIEKVPVIEVEGDMAVCDGGGGALGHPLEYIKIGSRGGEAVPCIYCGLKYRQKGGH